MRKRLTQIRSVLEKKPVFGAEIAKLVIMFMITANLYQVWCGDAADGLHFFRRKHRLVIYFLYVIIDL